MNLKNKKKLFIKTFGCQMNIYDSQKIIKILEDEYGLTEEVSEADLVIVNTCSVRDKPEQKVYSFLGEMREYKLRNPNLLVGVGGCVAQQEGENILRRSKIVDFVFGTHNISLVPTLIQERLENGRAVSALGYRDEWEALPLGLGGASGVSAFVAISRGCNKRCSYCIVPTTRGKEVSRAPDEIKREVQLLARNGVKEVVLLGQTVNSYGFDLKPAWSFADLLRSISDIEGIERIRFTSPHPNFMTPDLIACVADTPKICRHFHMPLQAGSDRILKLMKRGYTKERYLQTIAAIKDAIPEMAFTTDVIVGFPSETEAEFCETVEVLQLVPFVNTFSFAFSPRPGTPAETMAGQLSHTEKFARLYTYQAEQNKLEVAYLESWLGKECQILLEGESSGDNNLLFGRNSQNIVVNLTSQEVALELGTLVNVVITGMGRHTLKGEVLD